ncbi:MAG TPA: hypothetical protein PK402_04215 [Tepidisphaeraceae bacterium]|nr:hypothetical protein [Tepidisphaeraceae bacterium]
MTAHAGKLQIDARRDVTEASTSASSPWNVNGRKLARGTVNEFLFDRFNPSTAYPSAKVAIDAMKQGGAIVWIDADSTLFPPALFAMGVSPHQLIIVRPRQLDLVRAAVQCLRCAGAAAVIVPLPAKITRVEARRIQLAAEHGNSLGILLRPSIADTYAASTRWLISPALGDRTTQRWNAQFVHGYGWRIGQTFVVERHRYEPDQFAAISLHPASTLAHRPRDQAAKRITA